MQPVTPQSSTSSNPAPSRWVWGFLYRRPIGSDWVFWWTVAILALTVVAWFVRSADPALGRFDGVGFLIDVAVGLPLNFGVFVLPIAAVRYWIVRARRPRQPLAPRPTPAAASTRSIWDPQVESVWVGATEVVFQRTVTGRVTAAARRGSLNQQTLAHAKAQLRANQKERGDRPWSLG
ncbi:hypothetical protein ACF049_19225 [Cellulosimicrobium funkei]|uniref:hypothetical protein n=1 Tax=Cellulosimicrobium funkei TaxID=264251 RepID=UPI0036FD2E7E